MLLARTMTFNSQSLFDNSLSPHLTAVAEISFSDFCLWGSPDPNGSIGEVEAKVVTYCTNPQWGGRPISDGAIHGLQVAFVLPFSPSSPSSHPLSTPPPHLFSPAYLPSPHTVHAHLHIHPFKSSASSSPSPTPPSALSLAS
ncbi:hypothetical protein R3P38DRAFT_283349 [Favolaschia claudopus]|uniref:Uncharacterized protein n=1 Tax=Favolaschia claudopus TaxID=2862362 RepID=A0AAV9ZNP5_9AGAR